eukprot:5555054-Pyramimonas_sp.AAC.1
MWRSVCGAFDDAQSNISDQDIVQAIWCSLRWRNYVVQYRLCGELFVEQSMKCNMCGAISATKSCCAIYGGHKASTGTTATT